MWLRMGHAGTIYDKLMLGIGQKGIIIYDTLRLGMGHTGAICVIFRRVMGIKRL